MSSIPFIIKKEAGVPYLHFFNCKHDNNGQKIHKAHTLYGVFNALESQTQI